MGLLLVFGGLGICVMLGLELFVLECFLLLVVLGGMMLCVNVIGLVIFVEVVLYG